jgi:hypothetical protein
LLGTSLENTHALALGRNSQAIGGIKQTFSFNAAAIVNHMAAGKFRKRYLSLQEFYLVDEGF